jgi:hypothetical protein
MDKLAKTGMALEVEEPVAGFLGVLIKRNQSNGPMDLLS